MNPTRRQISDATGALGWRLVLGAIHAQVRVHTLAEAAEVATLAAAACPDASGHLSIDLSADRVVLRVQSEADGVVTDRDLDVAGRLAGALQTAGRTIEPGPDLHAFEIAIDALDIAAVRPFWKAVTGYRDARSTTDLNHGLLDPAGRGPAIWFQQMDSPRHETRNRIHLDVDVPHDQAAVRIAAALAAGGVMLSEHAAPAFWVLADAEGNEACVCTWQGRD
ncbi:MAG: VOC family protein [Mycobacterium sp.]|nr:VOC family protein [Mycobacterium sp.]